MIQLEFILSENIPQSQAITPVESVNGETAREEIELSRFSQIFDKTIKAKFTDEERDLFFKAICDNEIKFV